jgi:hypothetical protein
VTVDVYNLHMEAGRDREDDRLHDEAVTQLAALMEGYSAGRAVIVGGDFNMRETDVPDWAILHRLQALTGLRDACTALACPEVRIDKFFFRSGPALALTPVLWSNERRVFVDADGAPLSDHDPVAVRFAWRVGADSGRERDHKGVAIELRHPRGGEDPADTTAANHFLETRSTRQCAASEATTGSPPPRG